MNFVRIRGGCPPTVSCLIVFLVFLRMSACGDGEQRVNGGIPAEQNLLDVAGQVADTWIRTLEPEQIDWSWGDGVLMFGFSQLARRTGSEAYRDYVQAWMDHHIREGYYFAFSDNCPVGISAVRLFEETGEPRYREVMDRIWNYLRNVADRTSDGGLNHMGFISGNQIWVDSLFMFGIYLTEMSRLLEDRVYWEELAGQIRVFSSHLRNPANGLFLHMWDDDKKTRVPVEETFWARGNAWVFVTLVEFLTTLPEQDPLREEFVPHLTEMAETLARLQPDSGLWHTVLYDPETYQETSASAMFAYGFHKAVRLGALDPAHMEVVRKAMDGVQSRLYRGCNGGLIVSGTSHGTDPGEWEQYANITVGDQVPYGVGAVLLAAVEVGDWAARGRFPLRTPCPYIPEDPQTPEDFLARAVYRLGISDLEGAEEDFLALSALEPYKGEGPFGLALLQAFFTGFRAFDAFTRYTIEEVGWSEFQEVVREEILPDMEEIRQNLIAAHQDSTCYLHIPVLKINRRGLYTPILDLHFDSKAAGAALRLLDIAEWVFRLIS